jgi:hypothetical protein
MKKIITALMFVTVLSGCEDANNAIEQAQEAANKAVDGFQDKIELVDLSKVDLEQFGEAAELAKNLTSSVEEAINADFSDQETLAEIKENIAHAYSCLVDISSEATVRKLMDTVMESINNTEVLSLIEKGIQKAKTAKECVM